MTDLIVDTNGAYARAFYAVMADPLKTPKDAIQATVTTLLTLLNPGNDRLGERVDRILFAWDGAQKRDKQREPKPKEYYTTREMLKEVLELLFHGSQGYSAEHEADDVVATAVYASKADEIFVVSGDKDLQQLRGGKVSYYCLNKKCVLSSHSICSRFGIKQPNQVAIALAIIGDKIDCVQGIRGWGPARVKKLFEAVTPTMPFDEALEAVAVQIPEELQEGFYADLDLTLLNPFVPGIPEPGPLVLAEMDTVEELHMPGLMQYYRPVYMRYKQRAGADEDEEDVPVGVEDDER